MPEIADAEHDLGLQSGDLPDRATGFDALRDACDRNVAVVTPPIITWREAHGRATERAEGLFRCAIASSDCLGMAQLMALLIEMDELPARDLSIRVGCD